MPNDNKQIRARQGNPNDEFYTLYEDIEAEVVHYGDQFRGKIVYCNCDLYSKSNFYKYFKNNFNKLGLKKLIATNYIDGQCAFNIEHREYPKKALYDGYSEYIGVLGGNGSYDSQECINLLKECDIVVTNPPFSLFIDFFKTLMRYKKDFLMVSFFMCFGYSPILPYLANHSVRMGYTRDIRRFLRQDGTLDKMGNTQWLTTLKHDYLPDWKPSVKYNPNNYRFIDGLNLLNVNTYKDIPYDYDGIMAVPISYLSYWNHKDYHLMPKILNDRQMKIDGKYTFKRISIKKVKK